MQRLSCKVVRRLAVLDQIRRRMVVFVFLRPCWYGLVCMRLLRLGDEDANTLSKMFLV